MEGWLSTRNLSVVQVFVLSFELMDVHNTNQFYSVGFVNTNRKNITYYVQLR